MSTTNNYLHVTSLFFSMGGLGKRNRVAFLATNLPQLQNLIKRDPVSYHSEFMLQYSHFLSSLSLFVLQPATAPENFTEQAMFISHLCYYYKEETKEFPEQIMQLLSERAEGMEPNVRKALVQCLILLRNRDIVSSQSLLSLFFGLFRCQDKGLRTLLYTHIVNDIRHLNSKHVNNKLNRVLQNYMFTLLEQAEQSAQQALAAKKAMEICVELYRKNVWYVNNINTY